MAQFTIRVTLHGASWQEYVDLAAKLRAQEIVDVIRSDPGVWYRLPDGEYNYEGNASAGQIHNTVATIASSVVATLPAVLVTESVRRIWSGLEIVKVANSA